MRIFQECLQKSLRYYLFLILIWEENELHFIKKLNLIMIYTHKKNKLNSRNVVCRCMDPLSVLCLIRAGLIRGGGGVALRYAPEVQIGLARCVTHRRRRLPEKKNTYGDGVEPEKFIEEMQKLIASDPNCTRVVHEDISPRYLPS